MSNTQWKFYLSSGAAWEAMRQDIEAAERSIDIEEYIFLNDEAGGPIYEILMQKARSGVKVRLQLDSAGSFLTVHSPAFLRRLKESGIEIKIFNHIHFARLHRLLGWLFRDHRKIVVIDHEVAHTGGVCLQANMREWRDTQVRLTGPVVRQLSQIFESMWERRKHGGKPRFPRFKPTEDGFQMMFNAPRLRQRYIYYELLNRIRKAKERVYITTPYFIPNYRFLRVLRGAARRKVDVRLLLVDKSDHNFVDRASDFHIDAVLRSGGKVYRYGPEMLHAKGAVIDNWATTGSTNIDNLSLLLNHEANLVSNNPLFIKDVAGIFEDDLKSSRLLTLKAWRARPWTDKLLEKLTWPLHRFL